MFPNGRAGGIPRLMSCGILMLVLTACSSRQATPEQVLTIGLETSPLSLDPRLALDAASSRVIQLVFNGLVKKDRSAQILPDLAERWDTPDQTTYIFHNCLTDLAYAWVDPRIKYR